MISKKPIFILGLPRSGTTILEELFTAHKDTAYFENYSAKFYRRPWMFRFIPLLMKYRKLRYNIDRPKRSEGWVWDRYANLLDYLDESKVTEDKKRYYDEAIKYQLKAFNATRFVSKNPRNCMRIRWIDTMFPNAVYILIKREKKSVISSIYQALNRYKRKWGDQFLKPPSSLRGYGFIKTKLGSEKTDMQTSVEFYDMYSNALEKDLPTIADRTITIEYEEFVKDPRNTIKKLYEFTNLEWYDDLNKIIPEKLQLANNEKWKLLPEDEKKILLEYTENN
ncbi:MAG: sulfotransferase [Hydrogenophilales bacterium]